LLAPGGVFVTFENVRAETDAGHAMQRARWAAWQKRNGRADDAVKKHLAREGTSFFPIRTSEHDALLRRVFVERASIELVWRAYGQAGFAVMLAPPARGA
jgi:tRNA (cmo5U34)-methyltransferase